MATEEFMAAWADEFTAAEADGRDVEHFAALIGAEVPTLAEDACRGGHCPGTEPTGRSRYVATLHAHVVLCDDCAERLS